MAGDLQVGESVARRYAVLRPHLDERQRRLMLAAEAADPGRGGITVVAQATGVHPDTVAKGVRELEGGGEPAGRVRKPGGGRKPAAKTDPGLAPALKVLIDPETRGDPESPLVWTTKSTKNLAEALAAGGHRERVRGDAAAAGSVGAADRDRARGAGGPRRRARPGAH